MAIKTPPKKEGKPVKKTECSISRAAFKKLVMDANKGVPVTFDGSTPIVAEPKEFSTGSMGWYLNGKATIMVDGKPIKCQIGLNLTIVGSKELPKDEETDESSED